jgi:hypothetical protein
MKNSSVEIWQSCSGGAREQLVESWEVRIESSGVDCQPVGNGVTTEVEKPPLS